MFQVGDLVDVNPSIITGIYAAKFREMGCEDPHIGWTILNHRTLFDNGVPYTEWLADRGEVQGWVEEKNLVAHPPEPPKVATKVAFDVGDTVDLKYNAALQFPETATMRADVPQTGWKIVNFGGGGFYIRNGKFNAWARDIDLVARPKGLPTTMTMRVTDLSAEDDGGMRVNLYDGAAGASLFTKSIDHSIRLGDEYTVTISKKG